MLIRRLTIDRYQGIDRLEWYPSPGLNALVGPADAGKSTILSAIGLLFSPRAAPTVSEYDYHRRRVDKGLRIEAVIGGLSDELLASMTNPPIQGWHESMVVPVPEGAAEPVLLARVTATPDFEVVHELMTDDESSVGFGVGLRSRFQFTARLISDDSARNELRFVRGSALERRLTTSELRPALTAAVVNASVELGKSLPAELASELEYLKADFRAAGIPDALSIGIVAQEGFSPMGVVGLLDGATPEESIPVFRAGTGTRRLALAWVSKLAADSGLIVAVDEPEIGLEPYRQRALVRRLRDLSGAGGQAFITTHSVPLLAMLRPEEVWRLPPAGNPIALAQVPSRLLAQSPEAFLCRLPVLCEGPTEAGFLIPLLEAFAARTAAPRPDDLGIALLGRAGQPSVLREAESVLAAGMACGVFVDNETEHSGRRAALGSHEACALGTWHGVRNVEEAVAAWLPVANLDGVVGLAAQLAQRQVDSYSQQVNEKAGSPGERSISDLVGLIGEAQARSALASAMQAGSWFKTVERGHALGEALLNWGVPSQVQTTIDSFWTALRRLIT